MAPVLEPLVGGLPVQIEFWDGSALGPPDAGARISVRSPNAIRRLVWAPGELGLGRAYVSGEIDIEGDVIEVVHALHPAADDVRAGLKVAPALKAAARLSALGPPLPPPPEETRPRGVRHSKQRDAEVVRHHYDVGNDFYRLVLGPSMTYSCARFPTEAATLEEAQAAKHDLVCRKLGLAERPGMRLLDVGCGWGSMAMHAAQHYGAHVVGVTISQEQAEAARRRVAEAGLDDMVDIRLQDYRDLRNGSGGSGEQFDAISSIGMFEHVGRARMAEYFATLRSVLAPRGRLLNHAISSIGGSQLGRRTFVYRYVFPDGELLDVGDVVLAMEQAGFEVRDVESLREHYARTLRGWVANLEAHWDQAVSLVGQGRARVWRLYMAGSAVGFEDGGLSVHQVLGTASDATGSSGMPLTRDAWSR
jgi:cyclopropane-fatty-acyl-phospholipid synthase